MGSKKNPKAGRPAGGDLAKEANRKMAPGASKGTTSVPPRHKGKARGGK